VVLVVMTVVPTVLALAGWVVSVRRLLPAAGARASTERVAATARLLLEGVDTLHLTVRERALLRHHFNEVSASVSLARRAETFLRYYTAGFAVVILLLGAGVLYAAVNLAGHLSRQLSRPIDELVGWTSRIRRQEPLPIGLPSRGAPEFEALRQAPLVNAVWTDQGILLKKAINVGYAVALGDEGLVVPVSSRPSGCVHSAKWRGASRTRSRIR